MPFRAAIDAGVPGVTVGSALYPFSDFTVPASLSREVDTTLLRREMRFKGVAMTDDLADPAVTTLHTVPDAAVLAFRAGRGHALHLRRRGRPAGRVRGGAARGAARAHPAPRGSTRRSAASCWRSRTTG